MNKKRALITGINGQDGAYLARHLLDKGYDVYGAVRTIGANANRLQALEIVERLKFCRLDILESGTVCSALEEVRPDEVYNLAAQSFVASSFDDPIHTSQVDAIGALRVLESIRSVCPSARFYQASSSEMFGRARQVPQTENTPFHPRSPYGVAKLFGHWATVNYRETYGMFACSGILFNHESPLRGAEFVTRKVTRAFALMAVDDEATLELGNLDARRDWGFAGDYVDGMWRMLQADEPDDYVLATGETYSIRQLVETVAEYFGRAITWSGTGLEEVGADQASGRVLVTIRPEFYRPTELQTLVGDPRKAESRLGWNRNATFKDLIVMMAQADQRRVREGQFDI